MHPEFLLFIQKLIKMSKFASKSFKSSNGSTLNTHQAQKSRIFPITLDLTDFQENDKKKMCI